MSFFVQRLASALAIASEACARNAALIRMERSSHVGLDLVSEAAQGRRSEAAQGPEDLLLAAPDLKMLFCFVPKNACTQFNKLFNTLNGLSYSGAPCSPGEPNFRSSAMMHFQWSSSEVTSKIHDKTWTKAVFLRDPAERFVSAFRSKCEDGHSDSACGGLNCLDRNISKAVDKLQGNHNYHYMQQSTLCGGLATDIEEYDYIGRITNDLSDTHRQVKEMLDLAVQRMGSSLDPETKLSQITQKLHLNTSTSGWTKALADRLFPANDTDDEQIDASMQHYFSMPPNEIAEAVGKYFPSDEDGKAAQVGTHATGTNQSTSAHYLQGSLLDKVLAYYAPDYALLKSKPIVGRQQ